MGRAPCCDKANVKRGPWSPEEDSKLKSYIDEHGTGGNWIALPQKIGLKRCGKSCRLRWLNYLRPNIKHGGFSEEEDNIICSLYISIGSRWSIIAAQLPGRTDNDIKNYWNTRLKKKLLGKHRKGHQLARKQGMMKASANGSGGTSFNSVVPAADDQGPYWPELPVLAVPSQQQNHYQQQQQQQQQQPPCFNDHVSIRKLLIKLGGRFHSDVHVQQPSQNGPTNVDHQLPIGIHHPYTQQALYNDHHQHQHQQQHSSSPAANAAAGMMVVGPHDQFAQQEHYMVDADNGMVHMFEGQNGHYATDHQLLQGQRLDGLEFLYGEEEMMMVMNNNNNLGWGEMQLLCPPSLEAASASSSDADYNNNNNQGMERMNIPSAVVAANELSGFDNVNGLSSYFAGVQ